jgi:hypothetical protein
VFYREFAPTSARHSGSLLAGDGFTFSTCLSPRLEPREEMQRRWDFAKFTLFLWE